MKFVVSDLDGTLLHSHNIVSEYTIRTIDKLVKKNVNSLLLLGEDSKEFKVF